MATRYPDSKHKDPYRSGKLFERLAVATLKAQLGVHVTVFETEQQQYAIGESVEGYEIKEDRLCTSSRRLSIEIAEKRSLESARWTPSGIMRSDNTIWYVQGNVDVIWVFAKARLREIYARGVLPVVDDNPATIRKFYLPVNQARLEAQHQLVPQVCEYGRTPCPAWTNCRPCPHFVEPHCRSPSALALQAYLECAERQIKA